MATETSVLVRMSLPDRAALRELATRLQRNQNETIRVLVRETLAILKEQEMQKEEKTPAVICT
jgi:hypothetical protein